MPLPPSAPVRRRDGAREWPAAAARVFNAAISARAAASDVASTEPIENGNPLLQAPNLLITPHMAWATLEARQRLMQMTADNIKAFQGGVPINVVN